MLVEILIQFLVGSFHRVVKLEDFKGWYFNVQKIFFFLICFYKLSMMNKVCYDVWI